VAKTALHETRIAEKVLQNPQWPPEWPYTAQDLSRMDESDDEIFYDSPRLCYHIDDAAVSALTDYYGKIFKDGDDVLDICSSWVSHYPKDWKAGNVVGCGMNEYELSKNERLNSYVVQDLNKNPSFPFEDASFDTVTCVVSVDYLTKPKEVFQEIGRVLRPGGMCILSISNRCFPTKAWNLWLRTNDLEHIFIAGSFFHYAGMFEPPSCDDISPNPGRSDPLFIIKAVKKSE
jgi:SAM-dependent methyltransferase